ncbi:hypothetical protein CRG98_026290, partial [Punica granatum]
LSPAQVSKMEHILPTFIISSGPKNLQLLHKCIKLGARVSSLNQQEIMGLMRSAKSHQKKGRYLLVERNGNLSIVAHKDATASDILQSYIHALVEGHLAIDRSSTHSDSQSWIDKNYTEFLQKLKSSGWNTERLLSPSVVWRAHWSFQSLDEKVD